MKIAQFMGYEEDIILAILSKHDREGSLQVLMFLRWFKMPDCGEEENGFIFQQLKRACQIEDFPSNAVALGIYGGANIIFLMVIVKSTP